jgi:predicted nucleotidyltransferase
MEMNKALKQIKDEARAYGIRKLARDTGISRTSLIRFVDGGKDLTTSNLVKAMSILGFGFAKSAVALPSACNPEKRAAFTQLLELAIETYDPEEIIVFGSQARGDWREDSDLDFLVIEPRKRPEASLDVRAHRARVDAEFDCVVNTREEIEKGAKLSFYRTVKKEGVRAYARS